MLEIKLYNSEPNSLQDCIFQINNLFNNSNMNFIQFKQIEINNIINFIYKIYEEKYFISKIKSDYSSLITIYFSNIIVDFWNDGDIYYNFKNNTNDNQHIKDIDLFFKTMKLNILE